MLPHSYTYVVLYPVVNSWWMCVITEVVNGSAQYDMARAIIITFVINNNKNKDKNKPAEKWEEA